MKSFAILSLYWLSAFTAEWYYEPNLLIISPGQCAFYNDTCVEGLEDVCCPAIHDGLSCWSVAVSTPAYSPLDIYNASKDYKPVYQLCPTITNQVTPKTMRKYCSTKTGQWVNPNTMQPDQDYIEDADCYLNGQSPNLEERKKLSALTQDLMYRALQCGQSMDTKSDDAWHETFTQICIDKNYNSDAPAMKFKYSSDAQRLILEQGNFYFDGVMCFSSSEFVLPICPQNVDFYRTNSRGGYRIVDRESLANLTTEAEYGSGWRTCLRDDYKQLLTKYGLDQYFRDGCSPFKNDYVDLPFTKINQYASSPCNRIVSQSTEVRLEQFPMLDLTKQASFYCNTQREWEGNQEPQLNQGCYKTRYVDMIAALQDFSVDTCPAVEDKVIGEWPETPVGQNATASCQPLYDLYTQLNNGQKSDSERHVRNQQDSSKYALKRFCRADRKWANVNYYDCFEYSSESDKLKNMLKQSHMKRV